MNEEVQKIQAKLREIGITNDTRELAKLVGSPFDPENPVFHPVIESVFKTDTVAAGEDYDYFSADEDVKKVTAVVNGAVTQVVVTPLSEQTLTFSYRSSEEKIVYLDKLLEAKYDPMVKARIANMESLNRIELKDAITCIDGAVQTANTYSVRSGLDRIVWEDIVDMAHGLFDYADVTIDVDGNLKTNLVLITGSNITRDLMTLDYTENKERELFIRKAGISQWHTIGNQTVELNSDGQAAVMDADTAYIIAPNKQDGRETAHFVRRRTKDWLGDANAAELERFTKVFGPRLSEGATPKYGFSVVGFGGYGCVITNPNVIAKFSK